MALRYLLVPAALLGCVEVASADVIAYWNFNSGTGDPYSWAADAGAGSLLVDAAFSQVSTSGGSTLNALFGDLAGNALNLKSNANNGLGLNISFDTTGYENLQVSFATFSNSNGFNNNTLYYSINGGQNFIQFDTYSPPGAYGLVSFDLSPIGVLDDAGVVMLRFVLDGASNNGGMNRIDNLQINGTTVPVPAPLAMLVAAGVLRGRSRRRSA